MISALTEVINVNSLIQRRETWALITKLEEDSEATTLTRFIPCFRGKGALVFH